MRRPPHGPVCSQPCRSAGPTQCATLQGPSELCWTCEAVRLPGATQQTGADLLDVRGAEGFICLLLSTERCRRPMAMAVSAWLH